MNLTVKILYKTLLKHFGKQNWWPGDTQEEIIIGAVLTQNTNWSNVEKAIANLKQAKCLSLKKILKLSDSELAELIRPSGYFNVKAKRLKAVAEFFVKEYNYELSAWQKVSVSDMREKLLDVNGVGPETADSIINYAFNKPIFVIDAYTKRVATRHNLVSEDADYDCLQKYFLKHLPKTTEDYNEMHAQIVMLGKNYCKPKPKCELCPLNKFDKVI